jgi:hypothetical protein
MMRQLNRKLGFNPATWLADTRRVYRLVHAFDAPGEQRERTAKFAVVVMPWLGTAVPWFSLVCGLLLAADGNQVTFVLDDLPFGSHRIRFRFVLGCIRAVLRLVRARGYTVLTLSEWDRRESRDALGEVEEGCIARLAQLNAVWELRGEMSQVGRERHIEQSRLQLRSALVAVHSLLSRARWDVVLVPGGIYGSSGVWAQQARAAGIRLASFDSGGSGIVMLSADGIACQLQDIPRALGLLKGRDVSARERDFILETARAELARRRSGTDRFASQMKVNGAVDPRFDGGILLALNSSWDSAALGLHTVFDSSAEWIIETAKYLLDNTTLPVIVRQHPAERLESARSNDDYRAMLERRVGAHSRLHFVAAAEPVNSYQLLERVAAVVVYTSTIGIEAALSGKVVVTPSRSYYSDLNFVWKATTLDRYWQHLSNAASGKYVVTDLMREEALFCYYLTQCCNWVSSPFTPESFCEWSRLGPSDLRGNEGVQMTVRSLVENIPVAYLAHSANLQLRAAY